MLGNNSGWNGWFFTIINVFLLHNARWNLVNKFLKLLDAAKLMIFRVISLNEAFKIVFNLKILTGLSNLFFLAELKDFCYVDLLCLVKLTLFGSLDA